MRMDRIINENEYDKNENKQNYKGLRTSTMTVLCQKAIAIKEILESASLC